MESELLAYADVFQQHVAAFLIGTPRLFLMAQVCPFFGGQIVTGQIRFALVIALYVLLHPSLVEQIPPVDFTTASSLAFLCGLAVKESFIGLLLGFFSGFMFWTIQCAGFFIDNQRGAAQASEADPMTGEQTSVTGSFLFQSAVYVFFSTGAFLSFLGVVYSSYEIWPAASLLPGEVFRNSQLPLHFAGSVASLSLKMVLLAGPVVLACLFTDLALGLVNRFASQLNVYVLAMPIKSGISSFLLIFYFGMLMTGAVGMFEDFGREMQTLKAMMR